MTSKSVEGFVLIFAKGQLSGVLQQRKTIKIDTYFKYVSIYVHKHDFLFYQVYKLVVPMRLEPY